MSVVSKKLNDVLFPKSQLKNNNTGISQDGFKIQPVQETRRHTDHVHAGSNTRIFGESATWFSTSESERHLVGI